MFKQISLTNTFYDIVNTVQEIISNTNSFTDGPEFTSNSELIITNQNLGMNIFGSSIIQQNTITKTIVGNNVIITGSDYSLRSIQTTKTDTLISNNTATIHLTANTLRSNTGLSTFERSNIVSFDSTTSVFDSVNSITGNINSITLNTNNLIVNSGNLILEKLNASVVSINISTILLTVNSNIYLSNSHSSNLNNCIFSNVEGLTKANVGLSNVDNTSDSEKNSATANLSNKTIQSSVINLGKISYGSNTEPQTSFEISDKRFANKFAEEENGFINGAMQVWQRGNTFSNPYVGTSTQYGPDRWRLFKSGTGIITTTKSNNSLPTIESSYSMNSTVTATLTSDYNFIIMYNMEGYDWKKYANRDLTIKFWVKSSIAGIYSLALESWASNPCCVLEYTINSPDTWEEKIINIPPSPLLGDWNFTKYSGVRFLWTVAIATASSYKTSTIGTWQFNYSKWASTNQTNGIGPLNSSFHLTDVSINIGTIAKKFQRPNFEAEYRKCRRYFRKSFNYSITPATNVGLGSGELYYQSLKSSIAIIYPDTYNFSEPMRDTPNITIYNPLAATNHPRNITRSLNCNGTIIERRNQCGFGIITQQPSAALVGDVYSYHYTADSELT